MENATDALKMAAAVLIMIGALSVAIFAFTRARQASTAVMNKNSQSYYDAENLNITTNRKVGIETIIPTLYSYYKNNVTVLFYKGTGYNSKNNTFDNVEPLILYYTETLDSNIVENSKLQKSTLAVKDTDDKTNTRAIYGLDINDELTRQEPWTYNEDSRRKFIESLINSYEKNNVQNPHYSISRTLLSGKNYKIPNKNEYEMVFQYENIINGKLITNTTAKFVERIGEYNYDAIYESTTQAYNGTRTDSSVINFTNGESIKNEEGNKKKVIQYIYIASNKDE